MSGGPPDVGNGVQYDADTETYSATFAGRPSEAIIDFITEIWGPPSRDSEPLYDMIDPDALDELRPQWGSPSPGGDLSVTFLYRGYAVTVRSFGVIRAEPVHADRPNRE